MKCKFCNAQLEEGITLCPVCGKENAGQPETAVEETLHKAESAESIVEEIMSGIDEANIQVEEKMPELKTAKPAEKVSEGSADEESASAEEPAPKKKRKGWKIALAVVGGVVLVGVLVCAILYGMGFTAKENDVYYKDSYTVDDAKAVAKADTVVASVGDITLTNSELQIYYMTTVYDFLSSYSYYLSYFGLDYTQPLDEQYFTEDMTWQQYFLDNALSVWYSYAALEMAADEQGFAISQEGQENLNTLPEQLEELAESYELESALDMLVQDFGPGCTVDGYVGYMTDYSVAMEYFDTKYAELIPSEEDIEAYFTENEAAFSDSGITKDGGSYYDVRHILIPVEGGTTNESGETVYSDEEWAECLADAQAVYEQWLTGEATEDTFAALAEQYSTDTGSNTNGGLYSYLTADTSFVEEFKNWYLDESRQVGDTGLVQSVYGYHIMYFSGSEEIWHCEAAAELLSERVSQYLTDVEEKWPMEVNYKKIVLGDVSFT